MEFKMHAKAGLQPTEDVDKVIKALSNIFDYDDIEIGDNYVIVSGGNDSLTKLQKELRERKIRSAARIMLLKGIRSNKIYFNLSKQAALVGIPNFVDGDLSPLGEIEVEIETDDIEKFIDWFAPEIK